MTLEERIARRTWLLLIYGTIQFIFLAKIIQLLRRLIELS